MKIKGRRQSSNVEDRRGSGGMKVGGGIGIGAIVILLLSLLFGGDPSQILNQIMNQTQSPSDQATINYQDKEDVLGDFVKTIMASTEDIWSKEFKSQTGRNYVPPTLVIFSGSTQSACGYAQSATGPFYCPADQKIYIDLSFYDQLSQRFGASGDFAMAYVIAHEVGHHIQNLLGFTNKVHSMKNRVTTEEYNNLSVRLELQADFLAGVWARHENVRFNSLEDGDLEEALQAARAVGDDNIQKQTQGYIVPESFTHGTSKQRMQWFKKGFQTGELSQGDTFNTSNL